jgi:hypothetical protein
MLGLGSTTCAAFLDPPPTPTPVSRPPCVQVTTPVTSLLAAHSEDCVVVEQGLAALAALAALERNRMALMPVTTKALVRVWCVVCEEGCVESRGSGQLNPQSTRTALMSILNLLTSPPLPSPCA